MSKKSLLGRYLSENVIKHIWKKIMASDIHISVVSDGFSDILRQRKVTGK